MGLLLLSSLEYRLIGPFLNLLSVMSVDRFLPLPLRIVRAAVCYAALKIAVNGWVAQFICYFFVIFCD